jgi:hypothetical protein
MATTTERGLGWQHQQQRAALLRCLTPGTPCWWCARPMFLWQRLSADHVQARAHGGRRAGRLLHRRCNEQRGDGSRDHLRPSLTSVFRSQDTFTSRDW